MFVRLPTVVKPSIDTENKTMMNVTPINAYLDYQTYENVGEN